MSCDCGAAKVYKARDGGSEHSEWCSVSPSNFNTQKPNGAIADNTGVKGIFGYPATYITYVPAVIPRGYSAPAAPPPTAPTTVKTPFGPMPQVFCRGYCAKNLTPATQIFQMAGAKAEPACDQCLNTMVGWGIVTASWVYGDPNAPKVP